MTSGARMLADIGGTNARFAWQASPGQALEHVTVLQCADHTGLAQAVDAWLSQHRLARPKKAAMAVACAVQSDQIRLTNNDWSFSILDLKSQLGLQELVVVNDFTALALSLPSISADHLLQLGGQSQAPFEQRLPVALLGAGTGLGVSGLLPDRHGGWLALSGEGGHVSLSIHDEVQHQVWSVLQKRFGHVSAERVLSGQGLVNIYTSLQFLGSGPSSEQAITPAQVTDLALSQRDPLAVQALTLFARWLGSAAGDLALTLGATGGVFIGGGIAPRVADFLQGADFRRSFEDKGRFAAFLRPLPIWIIDTPISSALQGVATLLD